MSYYRLTALVNSAYVIGLICYDCCQALYLNIESCVCQERGISIDSELRCEASRIHCIERCDIVQLEYKDAMKVLVTVAKNKCYFCRPCLKNLEDQTKSIIHRFRDMFKVS